LLRNGVVIYGPVRVRTGRPSMPTPVGRFHVTFKDRHHVSSVYHVAMPYSVFFHGGDAFHEGSLRVSSHGCVHLSAAAAAKFFNTLHVGDMVQVVR
jgi:lipoprotein-anchoring transpeptidase ErfK/SrfK